MKHAHVCISLEIHVAMILVPCLFQAYSGLFKIIPGIFNFIPGLFKLIPGLFQLIPCLFQAYSGLIPGLFWAYSSLFRAYRGVIQTCSGLTPGLFRAYLCQSNSFLPHFSLFMVNQGFYDRLPKLLVQAFFALFGICLWGLRDMGGGPSIYLQN